MKKTNAGRASHSPYAFCETSPQVHFPRQKLKLQKRKEICNVIGILCIDLNYKELRNDDYIAPVDDPAFVCSEDDEPQGLLTSYYLQNYGSKKTAVITSPDNLESLFKSSGSETLKGESYESRESYETPSMVQPKYHLPFATSSICDDTEDENRFFSQKYMSPCSLDNIPPSIPEEQSCHSYLREDSTRSFQQLVSFISFVVREKNDLAEKVIGRSFLGYFRCRRRRSQQTMLSLLSKPIQLPKQFECACNINRHIHVFQRFLNSDRMKIRHDVVPHLEFLLEVALHLLLLRQTSTKLIRDVTINLLLRLKQIVLHGCIGMSTKASHNIKALIRMNRTTDEIPITSVNCVINYITKTWDTYYTSTSVADYKFLYSPFLFFTQFSAKTRLHQGEAKTNAAEMFQDPLLLSLGERYGCKVNVILNEPDKSVRVEILSNAFQANLVLCERKIKTTLQKYSFKEFQYTDKKTIAACATPKSLVLGEVDVFLQQLRKNMPKEKFADVERWSCSIRL